MSTEAQYVLRSLDYPWLMATTGGQWIADTRGCLGPERVRRQVIVGELEAGRLQLTGAFSVDEPHWKQQENDRG